jgi:hypothetical protein
MHETLSQFFVTLALQKPPLLPDFKPTVMELIYIIAGSETLLVMRSQECPYKAPPSSVS